jgi:lysozyme
MRLIILLIALPLLARAQSYEQLKAALIAHEGYSLSSYPDTKNRHTVGIGHLLPPGIKNVRWTHSQVDQAFRHDLNAAIQAARIEIPNYHDHAPEVRAVLVELAFQCGQTGLRQFKKFIAAMKKRDYVTAAKELANSKVAKQAPKRINSHAKVLTKAAKGVK